MRIAMGLLVCLGLLVGCGNGSSGGSGGDSESSAQKPTAEQIQNALQSKYRKELQERVDSMVGLVGEKRAKEALASTEGTADPAEVRVTSFHAEDIRQLDNGDVTGKVVFALEKGEQKHDDINQRVTLTKLQGKWMVIKQEPL